MQDATTPHQTGVAVAAAPLLASAAARLANRSTACIRQWRESGYLPATRTSSGVYLYVADDVLRVAADKDARRRIGHHDEGGR